MSDHCYWFRSTKFDLEPDEADDINPGIFGHQLASWLKGRLEEHGYAVEPVILEDWGRCLMCSRDPFMLWIGVGNVASDEIHETPPKESIVWHCFVEAEVPFLKRLFKKIDTSEALADLDSALREILEAESEIELVPEP